MKIERKHIKAKIEEEVIRNGIGTAENLSDSTIM